jgi:hypothetical protein
MQIEIKIFETPPNVNEKVDKTPPRSDSKALSPSILPEMRLALTIKKHPADFC